MKIRRKITLIFTLLASLVLLCSFTFVYYLSVNFSQNAFFDRLVEKATLTAWKYFEQDEMSSPVYQKVIISYSQSLPDSREIILNMADSLHSIDSARKVMPATLIPFLLKDHLIKFKNKDLQGVGIYYSDNQGNFLIIITSVDTYGIQKLNNLLEVLGIIFLFSIVLIYIIGQFYARRILSPLSQMLRDVRQIRAENLGVMLKTREGNDELSELVRTFNDMLGRLDKAFSMQKEFISNASHELKNPITAILGEAEIARSRERSTQEYVESLTIIENEAERLDHLTRNLLSLAQTDEALQSLKMEAVEIDEILIDIREYFNKTREQNRIIMTFPEEGNETDVYKINGIPYLLTIAFMNLLDNACKFSAYQKVDVAMSATRESVIIKISDKGIGIPESDINRLFQPFFRAANSLSFKGSGVGLSLVKRIIDLHLGSIDVQSAVGRGSTISLVFPRLAE